MSIIEDSKHLGVTNNVLFRVIDPVRGTVVQEVEGHNSATNSMLTGLSRYLIGNGVLNQGKDTLINYLPRYISVGTMGLMNQDEDADGLPSGLGEYGSAAQDEPTRLLEYLSHCPGYGADGYDVNNNNNRSYSGLGPEFSNRPDISLTVSCELISQSFPRVPITYRQIIPENLSELPKTIDVVFSALISTGALAQFRQSGKDYIFITEAGLWSKKFWTDGGDNGLLAGYRIAPSDKDKWCMTASMVTDDVLERYRETHPDVPSDEDEARIYVAMHNRIDLKKSILRVGMNQVVQIIWKIQLGGVDDLVGAGALDPERPTLYWTFWDEEQ